MAIPLESQMGGEASMVAKDIRWPAFVGVCLLLIAIQLTFLLDTRRWLDRIWGPATTQNPAAPPIGQLVRAGEGVQTQPSGEMTWDSAPTGGDVREFDRILTAETAEAEVAFLDGLGLVIGPNSLIELSRRNSGSGDAPIQIRLLRGTLRRARGRSARPASFLVGNSRILTSAEAEFLIKAQTGNAPEVTLTSGTAELSTPAQNLTIAAGQKAVIDADPSSQTLPEITRSPFAPLVPAPDQRWDLPASATEALIRFEWSGMPGTARDEPLLLEVARDTDFKQPLNSLRIPGTTQRRDRFSAELKLPVPAQIQTLYWRVSGIRTGESTEAYSFLLAPAPRAGAWKESGAAPKGPTAPEEEIPPPPDVDDAKVKVPIPPTHPSKATKPRRNSFWTWLIPEVWAADAPSPDAILVTITWKPVKGIYRYRIQIAEDRAFRSVVEQQDLETTSYEWHHRSESADKRYYYRVASMTGSGKVGGFSKAKIVRLPGAVEVYGATDGEEEEGEPREETVQTPEVVVAVADLQKETEPFRFVSARMGVEAGAGSHYQWSPSGSNLTEVSLGSLTYRNRIHLESGGGSTSQHPKLFLAFQLDLAGYRSPVGSLLAPTPSSVVIESSLDVFRVFRSGFGFGGTIDLAHRFLKNSPQTLGLWYGVSVGPSLLWRASLPEYSPFIPYEHRLIVRFPFSGLLYGQHLAADVDSSTRWRIFRGERWSLDGALDIRGAFQLWERSQLTLGLDGSFGVSVHAKWSL